jgi:hypothetical protein
LKLHANPEIFGTPLAGYMFHRPAQCTRPRKLITGSNVRIQDNRKRLTICPAVTAYRHSSHEGGDLCGTHFISQILRCPRKRVNPKSGQVQKACSSFGVGWVSTCPVHVGW